LPPSGKLLKNSRVTISDWRWPETSPYEFYPILNGSTLIDSYMMSAETLAEIRAEVEQQAASVGDKRYTLPRNS